MKYRAACSAIRPKQAHIPPSSSSKSSQLLLGQFGKVNRRLEQPPLQLLTIRLSDLKLTFKDKEVSQLLVSSHYVL